MCPIQCRLWRFFGGRGQWQSQLDLHCIGFSLLFQLQPAIQTTAILCCCCCLLKMMMMMKAIGLDCGNRNARSSCCALSVFALISLFLSQEANNSTFSDYHKSNAFAFRFMNTEALTDWGNTLVRKLLLLSHSIRKGPIVGTILLPSLQWTLNHKTTCTKLELPSSVSLLKKTLGFYRCVNARSCSYLGQSRIASCD